MILTDTQICEIINSSPGDNYQDVDFGELDEFFNESDYILWVLCVGLQFDRSLSILSVSVDSR